jgi:hypothetical protein
VTSSVAKTGAELFRERRRWTVKRRRGVLLAGAVAALFGLALLGTFVIRPAPAASTASPIVVNTGDLIQVAQTHISCGVLRRSGANVIQCVAPPPLRGTYGAVMSDRRVLVVRFRSNTTAKIVFTARQRKSASTCREGG